MKEFWVGAVVFSCLFLMGGPVSAQVHAPNGSAPGWMEEFFSSDLDELLKAFDEELNSTRGLLDQFVDPAFTDSTLMRLNDPDFGMSIDALMQELNGELFGEDSFGKLFEDLFENFGRSFQTLPFPADPHTAPGKPEGEGWEIIPNVPQPAPAPKPPARKQNISVI